MPEFNQDRSVLTMGCANAEEALKQLGLEFKSAGSWDECRRQLNEPGVRALVLRLGAEQGLPVELIGRARQEAPLIDVLAWVPDGSGESVRQALRQGAADVVLTSAPVDVAKAALRIIDRQTFLPRLQRFEIARARTSRFEGFVTKSARLWELFETVVQIAPTGASVLILGETGVGKELLARAVHKHSARSGRFVGVNCGAIPEGLIDSELFGHEEGTFTGATQSKPGLFRSADEGTLFLDEIGNLPLTSQYSFLRALQECAVRPVGGEHEIPVDVRIVAASSVPLDEDARVGVFREDLLYRLDVVRLEIPPLRERPEDVIHLFGYFRRKLAKQYGLDPPNATDGFLEALLAYDWPGNVRELENLTERLVLTHHGKRLTQRQFRTLKPPRRARSRDPRQAAAKDSPSTSGSERLTPVVSGLPVDLSSTLKANVERAQEQVEKRYLEATLRKTRGRIAETAHAAAISPRTLLRKLKKHGLDKSEFRRR